MPDRLPDVIDPISFADKRVHLVGEIGLDGLDRLADRLVDRAGKVRLDLQFGKSGRQVTITGRVAAELVLQCQCCMEPLNWRVESDLNLGVVSSIEEALLLPDSMEALMVETGGEVLTADIVQDELLLALPTIPQHPDCRPVNLNRQDSTRPNPFAELAQLKKNTSS